MWSTFKVTVKTLARNPNTYIWCLAFPVVLSTLFFAMFSGLKTLNRDDPVDVAVVADDAWDESAFSEVVDTLAKDDGDQLLVVHEVDSLEDGETLITSEEVAGVYSVDADGNLQLTLPPDASDNSIQIDSTILQTVADSYLQNMALLANIAEEDPMALADQDKVESALGLETSIESAQITHEVPDETVRYYYALLGMVALFCAQSALVAVSSVLPQESALGARRCVAGTSRAAQLIGIVLGGWAVNYACMVLAFAYIRLVGDVGFGGREGLVLLGLIPASLMASGIGTLVGALPIGSSMTRSGIMTVINIVCSALAGLYGEAVMEFADQLARDMPWETWVNPVKLSSDLFYSLYYYDVLTPFWSRCIMCLIYAVVTLGVSALIFRRQRYEHL